jgi:DNA-binding response OmpR family regulator
VRQRILIIDDEKDLCDLIMRILSEADFDTHCAHSLKEGKQKWDYLEPPIVVLDQNLPDGTGLDLLEANKHLLKKSLIVFITADTDEETKTRAERLGVAVFMYKPFSMNDIRDVVKAQQNRG